MKTAGSSHEKSVLVKSGVECVDWSEMIKSRKMHILLPPPSSSRYVRNYSALSRLIGTGLFGEKLSNAVKRHH